MNERELFHAAVEIANPGERSAYLDKACAGNTSLKRRVEGMLDVYPQLGEFLESPAIDLRGPATPPGSAGRFRLGRELARGGMGVVYRARDESLGRDVAVKVLHDRYPADSLVGRRFLNEARITAQLQHPGIPPVFEVGRLSDDRPYLAMKLIEGRTLEELLSERPEPGNDRGRFLAVFEQICQAVGFAHSKHILHRDLKPANVMVGAFGEVQVMDWGLAKLLDADDRAAHEPAAGAETTCGTATQTARGSETATLAGSMLGTPAFMAPEQAGGEPDRLDQRTDVFGLGAILCVILTGQPPYTEQSGEPVGLMAKRGTLADAHARLEQCGADAKLVELCRRCLSAERDARPPDAGAVAATIAGYLAGVEERSRQAELERTAAEARTAEQRKRRRVQLGLAAALLVLFGVVGFGVRWRERSEAAATADRAARAARTSAGVAEAVREARAQAEEAWNLADFPDRMQQVTDGALAALRRGEDLADGGAADDTTRDDLAAARRDVDDLARHTRLIHDCAAGMEQFISDGTGEGSNELTAQFARARRNLAAFQEFGVDPLRDPVDEVAQWVATSRLGDALLGILLDWRGNEVRDHRIGLVIRSARRLRGGAYARWQELLDAKDVPELVAFAASPAGLSFRPRLLSALGRDLFAVRQYAASRSFLRAALQRYPHDIWMHYDLAQNCRLTTPTDSAEALRHGSAAVVLRPGCAAFHLELGNCYAALRSYDQAVAAYRRSIELNRRAYFAYFRLGNVLVVKQDWDGAVAALREAIRLQPKHVIPRQRLGQVLAAAGRYDEALRTAAAVVREHPDLVEVPNGYFRYDAACYAMNCADGLGPNPPPPAERPAYRKQALEFLTDDLAELRKVADVAPVLVNTNMRRWLFDRKLVSVRHPMSIGLLPPAERDAWNRLWAEVRSLRDRTAAPTRQATMPAK